MFGHDWEPAAGEIVAQRDRAVRVNDWPAQAYAIDVRPDSGAPIFRAEVNQPVMHQMFKPPVVGDTVRVFADVAHQKAKFDLDDPQLSHESELRHRKDSFEATLDAPPDSP